MSKPIFFGRLDFMELMTAVSYLDSDKERSDWLRSFSSALARNEKGKNDLADKMLSEASGVRDYEADRKNRHRKFVPRCPGDIGGT